MQRGLLNVAEDNMFESMAKYMMRSLEERKYHIDLTEPCHEIGTTYSREYRGLLAHFLRTMLPTRKEAILCHACNNDGCSNPRHLYWGTYSENLNDAHRSQARIKNKGARLRRQSKARYASGEAARLSSV